jgi:penicillin-binding protein 2
LLGVDGIAEFARVLGFGSYTGIDLPGEAAGVVPDPEWKRKRLNDKWYKGDTVNYAIGQGYMLCTPLQVARMMAVFANGGFMVRPYIVSKIGGIDTMSGDKIEVDISSETLETVREGLWRVVNSPRGTGMKARLRGVEVAGKTGTAQTSRGKNHGWFAGFAPYDDPKLVVVVFDEYGGKGGYYAAQTAGKILNKANELGLLE